MQHGLLYFITLISLCSEVAAQDFSVNTSWSVRLAAPMLEIILTPIGRIQILVILAEIANYSRTLPRRL